VTDKFISPIVMHCHILNHEDLGMTMVVDIAPPGSLLRYLVYVHQLWAQTTTKSGSFPTFPNQAFSVIIFSTCAVFYQKVQRSLWPWFGSKSLISVAIATLGPWIMLIQVILRQWNRNVTNVWGLEPGRWKTLV